MQHWKALKGFGSIADQTQLKSCKRCAAKGVEPRPPATNTFPTDKIDLILDEDGLWDSTVPLHLRRKKLKRAVPDAQAPLFTMPEERA